MRKATVNLDKTISSKSHMLLVYSGDIDIIRRNLSKVTAIYSRIQKESKNMGLTINVDRTKLMLSANRPSSRLEQFVDVYNR